MTVFAFDGQTLVSDRQITTGSWARPGKKIFRFNDLLVAIEGDYSAAMAIMHWVLAGADRYKFPDLGKLGSGTVWVINKTTGCITRYEDSPYAMQHSSTMFAGGTGGGIAFGAMLAGKSALEAVELAIPHDTMCGCGVESLSIDG